MPQKKNPDTAEIMRAKAGSVAGAYTSALVNHQGPPHEFITGILSGTDPAPLEGDKGCRHEPASAA